MVSQSTYRRMLIFMLLGALFGGGCTPPPQVHQMAAPDHSKPSHTIAEINRTLSQAALQGSAPSADYRIGPEDLLQITVYNIPQAEGEMTPRTVQVRVNHQGKIMLPLLGEVQVEGLTPSELERTLQERYDEYIYNPEIGVLVTEYHQRASVIGAVLRPGVFDLSGPKTVIDLLAMAGGLTPDAGSQVHVYRRESEERQGRQSYVIDLLTLASNSGLISDINVNLPVEPGDVINVPPAGMFFVDGAVTRPGSYPLSRRYTITQALALAGGVNENLARSSGIVVFRREDPSKVEKIEVNLEKIRESGTGDIMIQAEDVIVVPISTGKWFLERFIGKIGVGGIPTLIPSPLQ